MCSCYLFIANTLLAVCQSIHDMANLTNFKLNSRLSLCAILARWRHEGNSYSRSTIDVSWFRCVWEESMSLVIHPDIVGCGKWWDQGHQRTVIGRFNRVFTIFPTSIFGWNNLSSQYRPFLTFGQLSISNLTSLNVNLCSRIRAPLISASCHLKACMLIRERIQ